MNVTAALQALAAAALFGLSPAVAKRLGLDMTPLAGSACLYGGAGLAMALALAAGRGRSREAGLRREDVPVLVAVVLVGGLGAPVALLFGLGHTTASTASLLLNLEMVFTAALAVVLFREHLGARAALAAALVVAGAAWLTFGPRADAGGASAAAGGLAIAGACLGWGLENNLTQKLSARDPRAIVACKGLGASACALVLVWATGAHWPSGRTAAAALVLGALSYGTSLLLFIRALRALGAARTGALFATAPFVGALASLALLGERPSGRLLGAGVLMALGVALLVREHHEHAHTHDALEHEHLHVHDEHHQHAHRGDEGPEPHSHRHRHQPITHTHPHAPDLHHRHGH